MKKSQTIIASLFVLLASQSSFACYEAAIMQPTPFMGNDGEIFKLSDGTIWEVKYEYEYLYEYYPDVVICPQKNILIVGDTKLDVVSLTGASSAPTKFFESTIDGEFEGWEGNTIVKLMNGQIWEQFEYHYEYHYSYLPSVLVYRANGIYKMQVEGTNKAVGVVQVK